MSDLTVFSQYSNISPYVVDEELWAPETERARIQSYAIYDQLYWTWRYGMKLDSGNGDPIQLPAPRLIVDSTAHFILKGLQIVPKAKASGEGDNEALTSFLTRERFYSRFNSNKVAGVRRGDWVFHMTADPRKPAGTRISLTAIDPGSYIPVWDEDDVDKLVAVHLVNQWEDDSGRPRVHRLTYTYEYTATGRRVRIDEGVYEVEGWWKGRSAKVVHTIQSGQYLPDLIDTIPVFHFPNIEEPDNPFGSSELRGFENLIEKIDQSITDEDVALALEGLGVYATDALPPVDEDTGEEENWVIAPGRVLETNGGTYFKRIEGVGSIKPFQDHIGFMVDSVYEASGTFRPSKIDVQVAESGVALALKFLPTQAKIEDRDTTGVDLINQMFFNWCRWMRSFESTGWGDTVAFIATIGDKLPTSRKERLNELNNMYDRDVISGAYYRAEMAKLGYVFPDDDKMMEEIFEEKKRKLELQQMFNPSTGTVGDMPPENDTVEGNDNRSNNRNRPNESGGTEAT